MFSVFSNVTNWLRLLVLSTLMSGLGVVVADDTSPLSGKNYSYLYFENGFPTPPAQIRVRYSQDQANLESLANPDLVFQTGYYSLMLDCDDVELKGYDAMAGADYFSALHEDVTEFTPATEFTLEVTQGGVVYACTGAVVQDSEGEGPWLKSLQYVRLVESGQYVKRVDHLGLVFRDAQGNELQVHEECRLEVNAWPDRITFVLDFTTETANPITHTKVQVVSPAGVTHLAEAQSNKARLTLKPQEDIKLSTLTSSDYVTQATNLQDNASLPVSFDADTHAFEIEVPADGVTYPSAANRVDEYLIEVSNPLASATNIPLRFIQPNPRAITGTVMLLSDADSGRPLGIPVQISKNWHGNSANVHAGNWLRGSTMLTLQPGESRRIQLRVAYGYWGGAGTVSHSQLSLVGYGNNWKWDQSALGAWGESMTFDPSQHAAGAFMADVRSTFTQSYKDNGQYKDSGISNTSHNWTENVGGGDFLIYRDSANAYHWLKRLKTCYYQTGPNLTEVHYSGVTDDGKIRVKYTSRMAATLDYHRRFHAYEYHFLEDVVDPERLVFYQMAGEYYFQNRSFSNFRIGDAGGLLETENIYGGTLAPVIVQSNETYTDISGVAAAASAIDLVNQGQATLSSSSVTASRRPENPEQSYNDGIAALDFANMTWFLDRDGHFPATVTLNLDVSTNTEGYNISEVNSLAGWSSGAQAHQVMTVEYSVVGSPDWIQLGDAAFIHEAAGSGEFSRIQLSAESAGFLAVGVDALKLTYAKPAATARMVLQEIDVFGVPQVSLIDGNTYKGEPIAMDGKWLSIEYEMAEQLARPARALHGLIPLSSTLNGDYLPLNMHKYGRTFGPWSSVLFDFSSDSVKRSYSAGDVVAGEMEFILPPKHRDDYWGTDAELIGRLDSYGDATWEPVRDELVENIQMDVTMHQGTLINSYPLHIQSSPGSKVLADLTIESGGIGHIPLILEWADADLELKVQRYNAGAWVDLESVDIESDTYYQAVLNADGTMDYTFSIPRPYGHHDLDAPWRVRILHAHQEVLNLSTADSVNSSGHLQIGDVGLIKRADSAWTVSNGTFSNTSLTDSRVAEGALGRIVAVDGLSVNQGNQLTLSFDYTLNDPAEVLYVHLWGLVGTPGADLQVMNLGAQNGSAWWNTGQEGILEMYNLADGAYTNGTWAAAAVSLSGTTGAQSYSCTFDLSGFSVAPNDLSNYDYVVLGLTRKINGASAPGVQVSNVVLSLQ